jgi:hypothetical protein
MATSTVGLAEATLRQQIEIFEGRAISLDSLWRAAGCPTGRDPRTWAELAGPLIAGFAGYRANLAAHAGRPQDARPVLWEWHAEDGDPWRTGDLMTNDLVARIYATFLDAMTSS